jgi:glycosyltransferase involved in cell wall biosynthesis
VLPSITETFGIVLVEAMAAGLPVITTDAPGCRDIIRKGKDGVMIPAQNPGALAGAMVRLTEDRDLLTNLSRKSLSRAEDFGWDSVVNRYEALYFDLISQKTFANSWR